MMSVCRLLQERVLAFILSRNTSRVCSHVSSVLFNTQYRIYVYYTTGTNGRDMGLDSYTNT